MHGTPPNAVLRRRIEIALRVLSPLLDLVLLAGDRVSRLLEPDDPEYAPPRMHHETETAPRGLHHRH